MNEFIMLSVFVFVFVLAIVCLVSMTLGCMVDSDEFPLVRWIITSFITAIMIVAFLIVKVLLK